jgi:hypothetical protein
VSDTMAQIVVRARKLWKDSSRRADCGHSQSGEQRQRFRSPVADSIDLSGTYRR